MKTEWDYTSLADAYLERPDYSKTAIDAMASVAQLSKGDRACDVGAGVAHLTLMLGSKNLHVSAVEPNDAMRKNGIERTKSFSNITWCEGTGENTKQDDQQFDIVTFGSSFNVCDRQLALQETARILKPHGWFACMWNHRELNDPIQSALESIIREYIPQYGYGSRRQDQREVIESSHLFENVIQLSANVTHSQSIEQCIVAWRSHATLERQAGELFPKIIDAISTYLTNLGENKIYIPYTTKIWMAKLK